MPWTPVQNINPFVFPFLIWLIIFIRMNRMKIQYISYPSLKRDDDGNSTAEMDDGNVSLPSRAPPGRTATRPRHPIADSGSASARAAEARRRQHYTALDKEQRYFKNRVLFHVGVLGMLLLFLALAYEVFYFYFRCEVSSQYRRALILLSHDVMDILKMESVPHWLDYSSLLAFNRGQLLNEWEYDVDISLIHPGQHPGSQEGRDRGVLHLRNLFHQQGYPTRYDPRVDLVQVFGAEKMYDDMSRMLQDKATLARGIRDLAQHDADWIELVKKRDLARMAEGIHHRVSNNALDLGIGAIQQRVTTNPHIDLWLWHTNTDICNITHTPTHPASEEGGEPTISKWISTSDPATVYRYRPETDIFPLKEVTWSGRVGVTVPQKHDRISEKEYSGYGGSYQQPQVFRGDCFHNLFAGRWAWTMEWGLNNWPAMDN